MEEENWGRSDLKLQFLQELRAQNFDSIRFASYRTACKLRFIQKKLNLHLIDIWNVIEAFRDHSLNTMEIESQLNVSRLESLISSLYQNLNKRLPPSQHILIDLCSSLLLNWLLCAYNVEGLGRIRVFSIKVALATMCAGKLVDKLRYIFSQVCDENGHMVISKFSLYLKQVLALPASVYESPSFVFKEELAAQVFGGNGKVTINDFLDTLMSDPGPPVLVWLPLLHRLASVENVVHGLQCDCCMKSDFTGFRYRCAKCHSYNLCQECFWLGRSSGNHSPDHEVREYASYSPSKQIGHSLRKSFRCIPDKQRNTLPRYPDCSTKSSVNLSHIVPPSPLPSHNGLQYRDGSLDMSRSPGKMQTLKIDDEHKLIARYAARLAQEVQAGRTPTDGSMLNLDTSRAQRELILQLEAKNREIMREIQRLRRQQECVGMDENPALMTELRALRKRKDELENHLTTLQDSRRHLMLQLEGLMKLLKNHQGSPKSTPNSSPRSCKSPPPSSRSAPPTPNSDRLGGFGASGLMGASNTSLNNSGRAVCTELLQAADSVTNAMSSLVSQLNSESDPEITPTEERVQRPLDYEDQAEEWREAHFNAYTQKEQELKEEKSEGLRKSEGDIWFNR
uniref:Dystrobrevin n=2 Tax=Lygus hesperus TaxID=30085 RepID=A0A0A9XY21_LYGHE